MTAGSEDPRQQPPRTIWVDPNICHPDELVEPPQYGAHPAPPEGERGMLNDHHPAPADPFGIPIEIWHTIAERLTWPQVLLLANSCLFLVPLRHALDLKLQYMLTPDYVARGILMYRISEGSRHIKMLITKDGRRNNVALRKEVEIGLEVFKQWWVYEPHERNAGKGDRQPQTTRHSDLGYAVLRAMRSGIRRYWRFRAIARQRIPLEGSYRQVLKEQAEDMLIGQESD